jgi:hypothetical protein
MGEAKVREFVRDGVQRAGRWGVTRSRNVCIYLDAMMRLGVDFDSDPRLASLRGILSCETDTETVRMDRLSQALE